MLKRYYFFLVFIVSFSINGQNITGKWSGELKIQKTAIPIVFNIKNTDQGYSATMDSPSQNVFNIKVDSITFKDSIVTISILKARIGYSGKLNDSGVFKGNFLQGNNKLPLNLKRKSVKENLRPQEPKKPYGYRVEEVSFFNREANINLYGTLTLPKNKNKFPIVILLSGSGPQNRNEEAFGHKPFLVIADYLTKKGIGVLRYDDRGTAKSEGNFKSANLSDFKSDAIAAINYLKTRKNLNFTKLGIIGHSEGGTIAPMIANSTKDVDFLVLLAGTILQGDEILLIQQQIAGKEAGASEEVLKKSKAISKGAYELIHSVKPINLKKELTTYIQKVLLDNPDGKSPNNEKSEFIKKQVARLMNPWMLSFVKYNPIDEYLKLTIPVFALFGSNDVQVTAKENIKAIKTIKERFSDSKIIFKQYKDLNHLFQESVTGSPKEYSKITQTISPFVLSDISQFILNLK